MNIIYTRTNYKYLIALAVAIFLFATGCNKKNKLPDDKPVIITTTNIIADVVKHIGGDFVYVHSLMPAGVDPHQYKASEGDVIRLASANIIFHNGLHLEGKLSEVLDRMQGTVQSVNVTQYVPRGELIYFEEQPDPHVWFSVDLWIHAVKRVTDALEQLDPDNTLYYRKNEHNYIQELLQLKGWAQSELDRVPEEHRVLVTSHDAFSYFGAAFGWEVVGIQGINTSSETSVKDINTLARAVVDKGITSIFTETSVSSRSVDALSASVKALGGSLRKGRELYSDTLGPIGSDADTYVKMIRANVTSIVSGILNEE